MKKHFFFCILILLYVLSLTATATELFAYSFENEEDALLWSGGFFDDSNSFESGYSIYINNPFGEIKNEKVTHVLDYSPKINLEAGKVYTLSGYAMNPLNTRDSTTHARATLGDGANTLIVSVSGINDEWSKFSTTFYAGESGEYNLSIHFGNANVDFGIFADEIKLEETPCTLSSLRIEGTEEILIPATGSIKNYYRPYILTSENKTVDILSSSNLYFSIADIPGVSFNSRDFSLTVNAGAPSDTAVNIDCTLRNFAGLTPTGLSIALTDNMIADGGFNEEDILWKSSSGIAVINEQNNRYISVPTNDYGSFGYFSALKYSSSQILLEGVTYIIRAKVKTDNPKAFSAIHAKNSAEFLDNTVYFNLKDISGTQWIDVFAAFVPEQSGIYDIALNLCSMYDCTIFADDISLSCENPAPEYITLHAPGNIAIPDVTTTYPISALLRDQLGNILPSDNIEITLVNGNEKITFDSISKLLTVNPDTPAGKYTLSATYTPFPEIKATLSFTVSHDYIGDGTFENTIPNEWWMVSSPYECDFYMRNDGHSRRALISCKGNYFMLLNNSYVHLIKNTPYVFNSVFAVPTDCTVTLFLEKIDGEILPLSQFFIKAGSTMNEKLTPELFLAEEDAVGRPFLYIESDNGMPFSVYTDNLSLKRASIAALNPRITGTPYVNGAAQAEFYLFNNISEDQDTSACAITWYVGESLNGEFTHLPYSGKNIYFDTTFFNKYVYFEVIPVCPLTGFSTDAVRSMPILIGYDTDDSSVLSPIFTPAMKDTLYEEAYFSDTKSHWSRKYVDALAYSKIVSGKSNDIFAPDDIISRAEFSKMLSSAFSISTATDLLFFTDVTRSDWYYNSITALYITGIVNGTSDTTFSPKKPLSREEAVVMIIRLYEKAVEAPTTKGEYTFTDQESISHWARADIGKAVRLKLAEGKPDGSFAPKKNLTRGEAATLIWKLSKKLLKG